MQGKSRHHHLLHQNLQQLHRQILLKLKHLRHRPRHLLMIVQTQATQISLDIAKTTHPRYNTDLFGRLAQLVRALR